MKSYTSFYKPLVLLGMPIVIGQFGSIVLAFADTLMIGHHSTVELAAAAFVNNMFKKHFSHKKVLYFLYFLYVCNSSSIRRYTTTQILRDILHGTHRRISVEPVSNTKCLSS